MQSPSPNRYYFSIYHPLDDITIIIIIIIAWCFIYIAPVISIPLHHMITAILITHCYYSSMFVYVKSSAGFVQSLHTDKNTRLGQNVCWQQDVGKTMYRLVDCPLLIIMEAVAVYFLYLSHFAWV